MLERRVIRRRTYSIIVSVLFGPVIGLMCGFLWFLSLLPLQETNSQPHADGIVVLTGAEFRIQNGLELLSEGRARRLLVTSEPPFASVSDLAARVPGFDPLIGCCVDIDHLATNTFGNAVAACRWTKKLGFGSLIIVTSNYHMPRALAEIRYRLPHAHLISVPVLNGPWLGLAVVEYMKFLLTQIRLTFLPFLQNHEAECAK